MEFGLADLVGWLVADEILPGSYERNTGVEEKLWSEYVEVVGDSLAGM
jgi:hypothetical protein